MDIIADSKTSLTPIRRLNGKEIVPDQQHQGYFVIALQAALHELQISDSFEESLVRIISIGGDTDTNACIAAVLLGTKLGVDSIPQDWIRDVLNAPIDRDFPFMKPLKEKTVEEFVTRLTNLS